MADPGLADYRDWLQHPVTKDVLDKLLIERDTMLINTMGTSEDKALEIMRVAKGLNHAVNYITALGESDEEEEKKDGADGAQNS